MLVNENNYKRIIEQLNASKTTVVAVSKIKPIAAIQALYDLGQRDFGENYVQEIVEKAAALPPDIRWHFIGHLQTNKVKYIAPFVHLIHGVDSEKLLMEIDKQGKKNNRVINGLLQVHIAEEETKFGLDVTAATALVHKIISEELVLTNTNIVGLMGMASFTDDTEKIKLEFAELAQLYQSLQTSLPSFNTLSMGMSSDYEWAIENGSNMVRIGSLLFGTR